MEETTRINPPTKEVQTPNNSIIINLPCLSFCFYYRSVKCPIPSMSFSPGWSCCSHSHLTWTCCKGGNALSVWTAVWLRATRGTAQAWKWCQQVIHELPEMTVFFVCFFYCTKCEWKEKLFSHDQLASAGCDEDNSQLHQVIDQYLYLSN